MHHFLSLYQHLILCYNITRPAHDSQPEGKTWQWSLGLKAQFPFKRIRSAFRCPHQDDQLSVAILRTEMIHIFGYTKSVPLRFLKAISYCSYLSVESDWRPGSRVCRQTTKLKIGILKNGAWMMCWMFFMAEVLLLWHSGIPIMPQLEWNSPCLFPVISSQRSHVPYSGISKRRKNVPPNISIVQKPL